jgi:hypothetical protein
MMRTGLAVIASVWLTSLAVASAQAESFTFACFDRNMDLTALVDQFPRSSHEFSPSANVRPRGSQ